MWPAFLFLNLMGGIAVCVGGMFFHIGPNHSALALPFFILAMNCAKELLEKWLNKDGEVDLSYSLSEVIPVSKYQILFMRILKKYSTPAEWVAIVVLFCNFYLTGESAIFSFISASILIVIICVIAEIYAFVTCDIPLKHPVNIGLGLTVIGYQLIAYSVTIPVVWTWTILCYAGIIAFLLWGGFLITLKYKRINMDAKVRVVETRVQNNEQKKVKKKAESLARSKWFARQNLTASFVLIIREILFLVRYKPLMLLHGLAVVVLSLLPATREESTRFLLPINVSVFTVTFASEYGVNYLGSENQDFLSILLSPLPNEKLLRVKVSVFAVLSFIVCLIMCVIHVFMFNLTLPMFVQELCMGSLAIALYSFGIHISSIKYYAAEKTKKRQQIFSQAINIVIYCLFCLFVAIVEWKLNQFVAICIASVVIIASMIFTFIKPTYFSNMLGDKREDILRELSK